jgi:hypothetical protein
VIATAAKAIKGCKSDLVMTENSVVNKDHIHFENIKVKPTRFSYFLRINTCMFPLDPLPFVLVMCTD